jgi:hypothetical protein
MNIEETKKRLDEMPADQATACTMGDFKEFLLAMDLEILEEEIAEDLVVATDVTDWYYVRACVGQRDAAALGKIFLSVFDRGMIKRAGIEFAEITARLQDMEDDRMVYPRKAL